MLNRSKDQFYAYKKSPEWDLPRSEEREAVEKTQQAVRDNEHEVRSMFRDDRPVDWVIMGGADAHDDMSARHWTVRGFQNGFARLTFHVFPGTNKATLYPNGGCRWQEAFEGQQGGLNLFYECRQLDVSGEQEGQVSGGDVNPGNQELEQTAERSNGAVIEGDELAERNARTDERPDEVNEMR